MEVWADFGAQLEEHRLKMEKLAALGQLAAGVAHEVNNPLAGIRNAFALFKANLSAGDATTIAVIDRGEGVAEETVAKIFDPFFSTKAHSPRQGMGLGLSVSRSLAEAMGGRVRFASEPGHGSRFEVELPRRI